jgi:membrane-bound lytic murein transglycosylase A
VAEDNLWRWQHAQAHIAKPAVEVVAFADMPGWPEDDHSAALACYLRSVDLANAKLPKPAEDTLAALLADRGKARQFFEENFAPFRVLAEPGLLTSYFQPVLKGSRTPSPAFPIPVYRRPADLAPLPFGHVLTANGLSAARNAPDRFEPYFTRAEIEEGALTGRGLEILYLADAIEAFIMHVQGSGLIELDDGTEARLTFDGKNGHPYTSVAKCLIERGHLAAKDAHLEGMVSWLRAQPNPATLLHENKSYIFFKEMDPAEPSPKGSLGVQLSAGRSLAADPLYHMLGIPIWVSAPQLAFDGQPFLKLVVAQDTGSAIKGAQRGDIFAGTGGEAGRVAGQIRHKCEFIVLQPRC